MSHIRSDTIRHAYPYFLLRRLDLSILFLTINIETLKLNQFQKSGNLVVNTVYFGRPIQSQEAPVHSLVEQVSDTNQTYKENVS